MAASLVMSDLGRRNRALESAQETFSSGEVIVEAPEPLALDQDLRHRMRHAKRAGCEGQPKVLERGINAIADGASHETLLVFGVRGYDVQVLSGHLDAIDIWHLLQRIRAKGEHLCVLKLRQPRAGPFG
jgi:hypothetical protein